jgi:integrase
MARTLNRLSDRKVRTARAGMYADGGGLWLRVDGDDNSLNRRWLFRFATGEAVVGAGGNKRSKERQMGLGAADTVTLAEARQRAAACRKMRERGIDPIEAKRAERGAQAVAPAKTMTFERCCEAYITAHRPGWKNIKHAAQWPSTLAIYAHPVIGTLSVQAIDTTLVSKVLEQTVRAERRYPSGPLWTARPETASRLRGRIEAVLDWAKVRGYREGENPARWKGHLDKLLAARSKVRKVKHHPALDYHDMPAFIAELRRRVGTSAIALEFLILNASRTSEVLNARPAEIDSRTKTWVIPPERMKSGKEHRIPLSARALAIIEHMKNDGAGYIFPGQKASAPLSNMAMAELLKEMGRAEITVHGFRSTFRDWAGETTAFAHDICEAALAHSRGDQTVKAYARGDLFEKRRELMEAWAKYCDKQPARS